VHVTAPKIWNRLSDGALQRVLLQEQR